ncbi:hypothetical protein [Calothrix sp. NIES-3974]|uniref:hypothetical protein n=1 Tax=Calothrix sp. NIES-3974 TaxID=2005462 RepID=UPI000B60A29B|nr:hypothetical protein [Calothrix sp. NIES-3974]BAZ05255.1 hypothetical protein NIES3974_19010 [Calothrix sp. NIES-3974]
MQAKQKVTLYLTPEVHKKLKINSAISSEPMSELAERALVFYLANSELVDGYEGVYGSTHRVYNCPHCESPLVLRDDELVALGKQAGIIAQEELDFDVIADGENESCPQGEGELVPC